MPQDLPKVSKPNAAEQAERGLIIKRVMLGLGVWGLVLGLGAMLFGVGPEGDMAIHFRPVRGIIVWACVGAFVGFWGWLLRQAKSK